jgi:uncharacterized protein YndB with AHSA1/START domain
VTVYARDMTAIVSASRDIAAPPDAVWALVSDLPRMGEWSDENDGGTWLGGADGPAPGVRFKGRNSNGWRRWSTVATITDAEPAKQLGFDVDLMKLVPVSHWEYRIEPADGGCRVTETWTDRRPGWFHAVARLATGVADREAHTRQSIDDTLAALAATAESAPTTS